MPAKLLTKMSDNNVRKILNFVKKEHLRTTLILIESICKRNYALANDLR